MAIQVHKGKKSTTAGPVVTPAPDARDKSFGRGSYGANAYGGPSSIAPGVTVESPLASDLRSGDDALDQVQRNGTAKPTPPSHGPGSQTRDLSDLADNNLAQVPNAFGMRGASRGGTVPAKTGASEGQPERQPVGGNTLDLSKGKY
jgi:hypothetical protein